MILDAIAAVFTVAGIVATGFAVWLVVAIVLDEHRVMSRDRRVRQTRVTSVARSRPQLRLVPRDELADRRASRRGGRCA